MNAIKLEVDKGDNMSCYNSCLICLQPVTQTNQEGCNSLKYLFNYLKIMDKVKPFVCEECGRNLERFRNLCDMLEKVRLEMDYLLSFVQTKISDSNNDLEVGNQTSLGYTSVRDSLVKKCDKQIRYAKAQIILHRLDMSKCIKSRNRSPSDCSDNWPSNIDENDGEMSSDFLQTVPYKSEDSAFPVISGSKTIKLEALEDAATFVKSSGKTFPSRKMATCTICFKTYSQRANLKVHMNAVHFRLKPFKCSKCSKSFCSSSSLRYHTDVVHLQKLNKCDVCGKSFASPHNLKLHKATPHKESSEISTPGMFSCEICDKSYAHLCTLQCHNKEFHLGMGKKFQCNICNKIFKKTSDLNRHISAIHDKQRHYCQVPGCNRSYTHRRWV